MNAFPLKVTIVIDLLLRKQKKSEFQWSEALTFRSFTDNYRLLFRHFQAFGRRVVFGYHVWHFPFG